MDVLQRIRIALLLSNYNFIFKKKERKSMSFLEWEVDTTSESDLELHLFMTKREQKKLFITHEVWIISAIIKWLNRSLMPVGWSGNPIG